MPQKLTSLATADFRKQLKRFIAIAKRVARHGVGPHRSDLASVLTSRDGVPALQVAYTAARRDNLPWADDLKSALIDAGRLLAGRGGDAAEMLADAQRVEAAVFPPRKSGEEITAELEKRRHTRFPGVRALAREYDVAPATVSRIIKRSAALSRWADRAALRRSPRATGGVDVAELSADRADEIARLAEDQARDDSDRIWSRP